MLEHLQTNGVELDNNDVSDLIKKLYAPRDLNENPATKFARDNKHEKQLIKKGITAQPLVRLVLTKSAFLATGEYNIAIWGLESKPAAHQTFVNFRPFIIAKYSKHYKNDRMVELSWQINASLV